MIRLSKKDKDLRERLENPTASWTMKEALRAEILFCQKDNPKSPLRLLMLKFVGTKEKTLRKWFSATRQSKTQQSSWPRGVQEAQLMTFLTCRGYRLEEFEEKTLVVRLLIRAIGQDVLSKERIISGTGLANWKTVLTVMKGLKKLTPMEEKKIDNFLNSKRVKELIDPKERDLFEKVHLLSL